MAKLEEITKKQHDYVCAHGGFGNLREADGVYNEINREQIAAFKEQHSVAYLGKINFHGEDREAVVAGSKSVYEEYTGQMVYNSGCSFCVPVADEKLAEMIRDWNRPGMPKKFEVSAITNRIEQIGGLNIIWY